MIIAALLSTVVPFLLLLLLSYLFSDVGMDAVFKHPDGWWPCVIPVVNIFILITLVILLVVHGPHPSSRMGRR